MPGIVEVRVIIKGIAATGNIIKVDIDDSGIPNGSNARNWKEIFSNPANYKDVYEILTE